MKKIIFLILPFLLSACATPVIMKEIKVISNPPKAKIEVNNDYIGETPCSIFVKEQSELWEKPYHKDLLITAIPIYTGHCSQIKYITSDDELPKNIYFEMGLCKDNDINVNIKK